MYWGYNLLKSEFPKAKKIKEQYTFYKNGEQLKKTILEISDGVIDATKVQDDWFPKINADLFISHSHADKDYAERFAMWMEDRFDLTSFIDSDCWGNKDSIIEKLWNKTNKEEFSLEEVLIMADNVSNILQGALVKMINQCDCFIFLNTNKSIIPYNIKLEESKTFSPWLYFELLIAKHIKQERRIYRNRYICDSSNSRSFYPTKPRFEHKAYLKNLALIDDEVLKKWDGSFLSTKNIDPLDALEKIALK